MEIKKINTNQNKTSLNKSDNNTNIKKNNDQKFKNYRPIEWSEFI